MDNLAKFRSDFILSVMLLYFEESFDFLAFNKELALENLS